MKASISRGVIAVLACASPALLAGAPGAQQAPPAPAPAQGSLRRVDPSGENDDPSNMKGLFTRAFDRERWRERLLASDLDQRERNLDALLKRARLDPVARAYLEELAADQKGGELAWTARLALRELGRASLPLQGFLGADPFGSAQRMQEWMEELFGRDGPGWMLRHPAHSAAPLALASRTSGRSVQVEQTAQGARVRITEIIDGQEQTRDFQGNSLAEILAANEELRGELDGLSIRVPGGVPIGLEFELGSRLDQRLRRFPRSAQQALPLEPQGRSRPVLTDRLGVIVEEVSAERALELGLENQGLLVERSYPQTYAHLLGVKAGDVLIELDDVPLRSPADIETVMGAREPDDELTLVWLDELGQRQEKTWRPDLDTRKR